MYVESETNIIFAVALYVDSNVKNVLAISCLEKKLVFHTEIYD